jgi:hypothetical protein
VGKYQGSLAKEEAKSKALIPAKLLKVSLSEQVT